MTNVKKRNLQDEKISSFSQHMTQSSLVISCLPFSIFRTATNCFDSAVGKKVEQKNTTVSLGFFPFSHHSICLSFSHSGSTMRRERAVSKEAHAASLQSRSLTLLVSNYEKANRCEVQ